MEWKIAVERELAAGRAAQARGNQSMARVCARRAAGWAAAAWLDARGQALQTPSVLEQLRQLAAVGSLPARGGEIVAHLLTYKTKHDMTDINEESHFPLDVDLITEAEELIELLFPQQKKAA
ncbi:MAG: hypothetical protein KIT46_03170 [Anaerolineales bacterium]|nr:hypothetical protein [Anaerolineales bacterium]MCW5855027.1 hypothetical protein [Anaerolineales bacterium]